MILGAVLAGGQSRRFGSDKALAMSRGATLLEHAVAALQAQCDAVIVVGRANAQCHNIDDWPQAGAGPLGGVAAALRFGREEGYSAVLTCGVDCLDLPHDLAVRLAPAPAYVAEQPVVGLWPVAAAEEAASRGAGEGSRSMRAFAEAVAARPVSVPAIRNINRPEDLAASASRTAAALEVSYDGMPGRQVLRPLAEEVPVAIEVNGVAYVVMMASASDLEDFAAGFALSEGFITAADEIIEAATARVERGVILRLTLSPERAAPLHDRVRMRVSEGSCGLCGLESLEEVLRPLARLAPTPAPAPAAIERALLALDRHQTEGLRTGAMHAAAFCDREGYILCLREDVGRHNALDKLFGALARQRINPARGFVVVTARCSYELVEKTVRARCPVLVAISAPTSLAVERARQAGLHLIALARRDTMLVFEPCALAEEGRDAV
ncbi:formate dehydrogenase accessory sulfurtransferase FdhD [Sphingopyxis sp. USTB-05]|uniref:formate dehydrogenase accessory sulfurtransferase FdhD n=1 Tax=Sphingopyxis sp. USTB-05 TaxID=2830667 RepID=UPI0034A187C6